MSRTIAGVHGKKPPGNERHVEVHGAAILALGVPTAGVSLEISISYLDSAFLDEEIEIEAKVLRVGKAIGVVNVELRKKKTGKVGGASHLGAWERLCGIVSLSQSFG